MKDPGTAYDDPILGKNVLNRVIWMAMWILASDNGGVHINSGIPNRAFYSASREIGGFAWEKAGKIWYLAFRDKIREKSDFRARAADMGHRTYCRGENSEAAAGSR